MGFKQLTAIFSIASAPLCSATSFMWEEGSILGLRTNSTTGYTFDGVAPSSEDLDEDGNLDDGMSVILTSGLNVDTEPLGAAAGIDLSGDNFDWIMHFRLYDADGIFTFTENFDDSARFNASPIVSNIDGTTRGAAGPTFSDTTWNSRTYAEYDFSVGAGGPGGGWFDISIELDENGGGAQSASGIGIGFFNDASTTPGDFGGIGYSASSGGQATFDSDGNGNSFGAAITVPEPTINLIGLSSLCLLIYRRRQ